MTSRAATSWSTRSRSYIAKKAARVEETDPPEFGEAYTFVAIDKGSRLVVSFLVGKRDDATTKAFIKDLRSRLVVMPAMTSDGWSSYVDAIGDSFGQSIDYAQTVKNFTGHKQRDDDHRYEPPRNPFITKKVIYGAPDLDRASTAYVERNNGTMRHTIGRMRRLCYAFSKRMRNHRASVALNYVHYNFCHIVKTLRVTPAMAAGITDHVWDIEEFFGGVISAPAAEPPEAKPLIHRAPDGTFRELPGGRGFLRIVKSGGGPGASPQVSGKSDLGQLELFDDDTDD